MAGSRIPGPLTENSTRVADDSTTLAREVDSPAPIGSDAADAIQLDSMPKISTVTKDWTDPPAVTTTFTEVSGADLKTVLAKLQQLDEWGSGGGNLSGTGDGGQINADPTPDGKSYTIALKGEFFMKLPKWKEYDKATPAQKTAWDDMLANLKLHEQEHVNISWRAANKLVNDLPGKPADVAVQKIADSQTKTQNAQDAFDTKTAHGATATPGFPKVELDVSADPPPKAKP